MNMKGLFITLEGPDGSGKSTLAKKLADYLKKKDYDIIITREPGGTKISEDIRKIILDSENTNMSYITEALLYAASRAQHVHEKIKPALEGGKVVISERFVHSSWVYQGIGRGLGIEKVKEINDFAIQGIEPDVTLFFDIDPERAVERKTKGNRGDRLEKEDIQFHKQVYEGYLKLIKMYPDKIRVIDAARNSEDIFEEVVDIIDNLIKKRKGE